MEATCKPTARVQAGVLLAIVGIYVSSCTADSTPQPQPLQTLVPSSLISPMSIPEQSPESVQVDLTVTSTLPSIDYKSVVWEAINPDPDMSVIRIEWPDPRPECGGVVAAALQENPEQIVIDLIAGQINLAPGQGCASTFTLTTTAIQLDAPLGNRSILYHGLPSS